MCPLALELARFPEHDKNGPSIPSRESTNADLRHRLEFGAIKVPERYVA